MKFLKVGVTRLSSTDLYIEVPDDFPEVTILGRKYRKEIGEIAMDTTDNMDWDDSGWEKDVDVLSVEVVDD